VKIKDNYNTDCAKLLANKISPFYPSFNGTQFTTYIAENALDKEFSERIEIFVNAFEVCLPDDYEHNIELFVKILGPELKQETGMFSEGWWLWPVGRYVERHGIENSKLSLNFIEELTKRFTGEFAIRPLLELKTKETMRRMIKWSKSPNVHIRRLASEGVRIALPWAKKTYKGVEEFESYKIILSNLRNDKSKFVQKSVGNNLNDLYKEFPDKANEIINEWKSETMTKECEWIINHGLRSLRKNKSL
jgi:3-methyladenine DNA glycosylase AlkC